VPEGDKGRIRSFIGREHDPHDAYRRDQERVQGGGMTSEPLRMHVLAIIVLTGLVTGCQEPAPAGLPEQFLTNPAVEACAARVQPVEAVRGALLFGAEHGLRPFRPVATGTLVRPAKLDIGRGEPFQALAERLRRSGRPSIEVDVTFDGWLLRKSVCPSLDGDTYFIRQLTNIVTQDTEIP
jgi:hypothetical protein